jgi:phage gp36-like protein
MSYVSPADLIAEFGEQEMIDQTDRATPRTHAVDSAVAQRACDRANAEVDAVLAGRYALPLSSVPVLLCYLALDLAYFYLHQAEPNALVKTKYETAQKNLGYIRKGELQLGVDALGAPLPDESQNLPEVVSDGKHFGRGY